MGLKETELQLIVDAWRTANPRIVQYWRDVEAAAIQAISTRSSVPLGNIEFSATKGVLLLSSSSQAGAWPT